MFVYTYVHRTYLSIFICLCILPPFLTKFRFAIQIYGALKEKYNDCWLLLVGRMWVNDYMWSCGGTSSNEILFFDLRLLLLPEPFTQHRAVKHNRSKWIGMWKGFVVTKLKTHLHITVYSSHIAHVSTTLTDLWVLVQEWTINDIGNGSWAVIWIRLPQRSHYTSLSICKLSPHSNIESKIRAMVLIVIRFTWTGIENYQ